MRSPRVVAWMAATPSVRVMARATAEAALRGAELQLLSATPAPPQWSSWQAAAANLGVSATWTVTAASPQHGGVPDALLAEVSHACLVVAGAESLCGELGRSLARRVDLYVVAKGLVNSRSRMRQPAVVVSVPDCTDCAHLLSVASQEADLRHRPLIAIHAQSHSLTNPDHLREHRWLDALTPARQNEAGHSLEPRVVVTQRSVLDALHDHVQCEDVLVVGLHPRDVAPVEDISAALLEAPPCDLLLTRTPGVATALAV